jgi:hypothetical protein
MPDYDNTNRGVIFRHPKTSDNQPDWKGRGNFQGAEFEVSMWERTSKSDKPYMSISFSKPYQKTEGGAWEQQREKFAKKDEPLTEVSDEPIDMSEIPF